jgi:hypothetical protein
VRAHQLIVEHGKHDPRVLLGAGLILWSESIVIVKVLLLENELPLPVARLPKIERVLSTASPTWALTGVVFSIDLMNGAGLKSGWVR